MKHNNYSNSSMVIKPLGFVCELVFGGEASGGLIFLFNSRTQKKKFFKIIEKGHDK
jgi:hypothetical protein